MDRELRRLFAAALPAQGGEVSLASESLDHARVLRLQAGADLCLFDGRGGQARARLLSLKRAPHCEAEPAERVPAPLPRVHLVIGLPKADKLERIARMATELGVAGLHPALTERCVPRPKGSDDRLARLSRITREACAQSGQAFAPELSAPAELLAIAQRAPRDADRLVFWEQAREPIPALEAAGASEARELWAVIGPEGGLSEREVELLVEQGFTAVSLGAARLRVDTAAVVALGLLLERVGRLRLPDPG